MRQLIFFVIVGLAFTTLQVAAVGAQEADLGLEEPPMCGYVPCDPVADLPIKAQEVDLGVEEPLMCGDAPCDPVADLPIKAQEVDLGVEEPLMCGDAPCEELPMCGDIPCDPVVEVEEDFRRLPLPEDMGKFFEYDKEYRANGALSQVSYDELSEAGYTKKRVDWVLTQIKELLQSRHGGD
jgi:hypothetical protein